MEKPHAVKSLNNHLIRCFFRRIHMEVYCKNVIEKPFVTFKLECCDVQSHITSSLQVKMVNYVWIQEETDVLFFILFFYN